MLQDEITKPMSTDSSFANVTVALCICTCNRPEGLRRALEGVAQSAFAGRLRVIVADNHAGLAGMKLCEEMAPSYRFPLVWLAEPQPGISHVRNAALRTALTAACDFVAFKIGRAHV